MSLYLIILDKYWKFQRYEVLNETENFCILPPPLNIFYYIIIKPIRFLTNSLQKPSVDSLSTEISRYNN